MMRLSSTAGHVSAGTAAHRLAARVFSTASGTIRTQRPRAPAAELLEEESPRSIGRSSDGSNFPQRRQPLSDAAMRQLRYDTTQPDVAPPTAFPAAPRLTTALAGRVPEVDAGIARELRRLTTPMDILRHYRENTDDYNIVNLSMAMHKILTLTAETKRWKLRSLPATHLDMLSSHAAASLRAAMKTDRDFREWSKSGAKDGAGGQFLLPMRTIVATLHSLSKLARCPNSLLQDVSYTLLDRVGEMRSADVSQLAYAFSRSNAPAPILFNRLAKQVEGSLEAFSDMELTSILSSFSSLRTAAPSMFTAIVDRLCARREQRNTITPRMLSTTVLSCVRSIDHDARMPARLASKRALTSTEADEDAQDASSTSIASHRTAAIKALETLGPRVESTARKNRVPLPSDGPDGNAFTTQGLATVAYAYSHAYTAPEYMRSTRNVFSGSGARVIRGSHTRMVAYAMVNAAGVAGGGSAGTEAAAGMLNTALTFGADYLVKEELGNNPAKATLSDGTVVRVVSALCAALRHPQTLATAPGVHLAMIATALTSVRATMLHRLSGVQGITELIRTMAVTAAQASALEAAINAESAMLELLRSLEAKRNLEAIASAVVRVLDPSSGGTELAARAQTGLTMVTGEAAVSRGASEDKADEDRSFMEAVAESAPTASRSRQLGAIGRVLGAEDVEEETRAALAMLNIADSEMEEEVRGRVVQAGDGVRARVTDGASSVEVATGGAGEGGRSLSPLAAAAASPPAKTKYNPLAYEQSVALAVPLSMHDCTEIASAFAEASPLLYVPELWAKLADRVERGIVSDGQGPKRILILGGRSDDSMSRALSQEVGRKNADGMEDKVRDMSAPDTARLVKAFAIAAPEAHAARVLKAVAVTFTLEDEGEAGSILSTAIEQYGAAGEAEEVWADAEAAAEELSVVEQDGEPVTPSFDEDPTWLADVREALRRARTFHRAPALPVYRLRGERLDGALVREHMPQAGEDGALAGGEGDPDAEALRAAEAPKRANGTTGTWSSRLLQRSAAQTLSDTLTAYALVFPPRAHATGAKRSAEELAGQVTTAFHGAVEGAEGMTPERVGAAIELAREAASASSSTFTLPMSWNIRGGPLAHEQPVPLTRAWAVPDSRPGDKDALPYKAHPIFRTERWRTGLAAFAADAATRETARRGRLGLGQAGGAGQVSDEAALASVGHLMRIFCARLSVRIRGHELSTEAMSDVLVLMCGRDFSAVQAGERSLAVGAGKAMTKPNAASPHALLLRAQATWLTEHLQLVQSNEAKRSASQRESRGKRRDALGFSRTGAKPAPWAPAGAKAELPPPPVVLTTQPSRLNLSLNTYGGLGLAMGMEAWDSIVAGGFVLSPPLMAKYATTVPALLMLLDEASRRFASEYELRDRMIKSEGKKADAETVENADLLRADMAISSFGAILAAAVAPFALATVPAPKLTAPAATIEALNSAKRLKALSTSFLRAVAAGPALDLDPRLRDAGLSNRRPGASTLEVLLASGTPAQRKEEVHHMTARAVMRSAVAGAALASRAALDLHLHMGGEAAGTEVETAARRSR
jgi:hypothetical protein